MWGVEESSHLERVNTYRCNIYRGWTVVKKNLRRIHVCFQQFMIDDLITPSNKINPL